MVAKYCLYFVCVTTVAGFLFDDPCDVHPKYGSIPDDPDFTTDVSVPVSCRNGTFRWDYPKGHTIVTFHNVHRTPTTICIRDSLGGDAFTITDITTHQPVENFDYDHWACTAEMTELEMVLKIDAPEEMRYMGEVAYKLQ